MKRVAAQIADQEQRIDVLINNAGALFARRRLTQDGLEFTFALNLMAYFVLTEGLRERLLASRPARIINTASAAHQDAILEFESLGTVQHPIYAGARAPAARRVRKQSSISRPRRTWLRLRGNTFTSVSRPRRRCRHATIDLLCCCGSVAQYWPA